MRRLAFMLVTAILVVFSLSIATADLREGLVVYLNFDEEGDVVKDLSGTGNDGEVVGDPEWIDGPKPEFGKAIEFNADGDWVEVADDDSMDVGEGDITFAMWTKHTDDQEGYATRPMSKLPLYGTNGPGFEIGTLGNLLKESRPLGLFYGLSGASRQTVDADLEDIADDSMASCSCIERRG